MLIQQPQPWNPAVASNERKNRSNESILAALLWQNWDISVFMKSKQNPGCVTSTGCIYVGGCCSCLRLQSVTHLLYFVFYSFLLINMLWMPPASSVISLSLGSLQRMRPSGEQSSYPAYKYVVMQVRNVSTFLGDIKSVLLTFRSSRRASSGTL